MELLTKVAQASRYFLVTIVTLITLNLIKVAQAILSVRRSLKGSVNIVSAIFTVFLAGFLISILVYINATLRTSLNSTTTNSVFDQINNALMMVVNLLGPYGIIAVAGAILALVLGIYAYFRAQSA